MDSSAANHLLAIVRAQKEGKPAGIYSICSANRFVIEACLLHAKDHDLPVLIEATSNQVNQFGGYTGMTPADFAAYVRGLAAAIGFPAAKLILGGDHLGPNAWQAEPAAAAMAKAREMIRQYVAAGFTKIHLDASMRCADDPGGKHSPLREEIVAERAADLCRAAESASADGLAGAAKPLYVIGTEVPIPGGAQEVEATLAVTRSEDVARTIDLNKAAFLAQGVPEAWDRVIAVVVQPGVEFGDASVFAYRREKAAGLTGLIRQYGSLVFEAHSTDYQREIELRALVEDGFAILKVGPWLTFAFREAVFALEAMESEWLAGREGVAPSQLKANMERVMLADPGDWQKHYHGDPHYLAYARKYSYSDRIRYYWGRPEAAAAVDRLIGNLTAGPVPLSLLSQFMPAQYQAVRSGLLQNTPAALIQHKIIEVAGVYARACGLVPS